MGDSTVFGQFVPIHKTWACLVSQSLQEDNPGLVTQVTAVNGETTRLALDRLYFSVSAHKPTHVFLQYGINDANFWQTDAGIPRVPLYSFKSNLRELLDRTFASGIKELFLGTNHSIGFNKPLPIGKSLRETVQKYNEVIREVAREAISDGIRVTLVDFETLLQHTFLDSILLSDGVHLNELGHVKYFEIAIQHLRPSFEG